MVEALAIKALVVKDLVEAMADKDLVAKVVMGAASVHHTDMVFKVA
jgi:hypothetical protein